MVITVNQRSFVYSVIRNPLMKIFLLRLKFILQNYTMHLYTEMTAGAVIH